MPSTLRRATIVAPVAGNYQLYIAGQLCQISVRACSNTVSLVVFSHRTNSLRIANSRSR